MQFKTSQALTLAGVTGDQWRYWKSKLPPLFRHDGRKTAFTIEEIVALAVIARAVGRFNIPVADFVERATDIFDIVTRHLQGLGGANYLFFTVDDMLHGGPGDLPHADICAVIRIDLVADVIRTRLLEAEDPQLNLGLADPPPRKTHS